MRPQWMILGTARAMALVLITTMTPVLAVPGVAGAVEPSVPLPKTGSVPVRQEVWKSRGQDGATFHAVTGDQDPWEADAGSSTPTATSLSPSGTWDVSTHTGDFNWSYPLRVPPAPGGLEPELALSYRSSAVDGRTSVTNNQPSWIGDGWDLSPGFVERTYGACVDDGEPGPQTGDLCWRTDNATATYGGGGGMLICCDGDKRWRAKNDDGSRIERFTGGGNDDDNGEHWRITTVDGTQYWFGSQRDSTWTVPVFGDDAGEPCHRPGSFADWQCVQAWRWNLDKVVDRNGNVIRYFYEPERNRYGMNMKDAGVEYVRGGVLRRIEYGLSEKLSGRATGLVEFTPANRCLPGSDCHLSRKGNWPDTPLDQNCDASPCTKHSPTFWSTKRLSMITTKVWDGSRYDDVDRWTLDQQYPNPGDGDKPALWLKSIKHTGLAGAGPDLELPAVSFEGEQFPNRVYALNDGYAPLIRYRVTGVISESGGVMSVTYASQCTPNNKPTEESKNTMWCFPVTWAPPGHRDRTDYFHKYVVAVVTQSDQLSSGTDHVTRYEYLDGAAWHWDMSEFVKDSKKTWNEFRGFGRVRIRTGLAQEEDPGGSPRTMSEHRYYRGMLNDRLTKEGGTKPPLVPVRDSTGRVLEDHDWLQGFEFETINFEHEAASPATPPFVTRAITDPTWDGPRAVRGELKSYFVGPGTQRHDTALKSGGWRETSTTTEYDSRGLPKEVDDLGDKATTEDDRCTTTTYAADTGSWMLDRPVEIKAVSVNCDATARFPEHAISASRFSYDDSGNMITTEVAKDWPAADPVYVTTGTASHDGHGRTIESKDAMGAVTSIGFTPRTGGPVTAITTTGPAVFPTNPLSGLVTTTTVEPAFGQPVKVVDPNGQLTETEYDALGRISKVWLPNRLRNGDPPNPQGSAEFTYEIRRDGPAVVTTTRIGPNGLPASSNTLFDGLLRPRQVQTPAVGEGALPKNDGRLILDTRYDSHGRAYKTTQAYFNSAPVDTKLWLASDTEIPGLTRTRFDGAGRPVESVYQRGALDDWRTKTSYDGDRVHTTPPAGGTATTVVTNALGQTTELRQYKGATPTGDYDKSSYSYTPAGQLTEVTGPDGAVWTFGYDLRGRKITTTDPDAGTSTMGYDNAGRITSVTDARGTTLVNTYDALGRKTALHKDNLSGPKLVQWTYDTATNGKGLPASSTRFLGENSYTATVNSYTALGLPSETTMSIPAVEGPLAGIYTTKFTYGNDGSLATERYPKIGDPTKRGLAAETVNYDLDEWGRPRTTSTPGGKLVAGTLYTRYGEVERLEHAVTPKRVWQSFYYDTNTRRLTRSIVDAEVSTPLQSDTRYTYDAAGTITSIADLAGQTSDIQCFRHDHLRRLTEAWTPAKDTWSEKDGCTKAPGDGGVQGSAPYWHSYTYDAGGNRRTETQRTATASSTRTYTYPATGQRHTLRSVTGGAGTETYDYNAAGFTTHRTKPGADETFTWDPEGHLESVTDTATDQTTSFVYTSGGDRLLRKDPTGTTLYLGGQELRLNKGEDDPVATRYYSHGGKTIAMRQGTTLTWLASDHQGTSQVAINSDTRAVTQRRQLPFGAPRGAALAWPGERGFVGGTMDASTGLVHLGAREYDPGTGRFISVDPLMNVADPQQMHGYAYGNNSPVTFSDPTGSYGICDGCTANNPDSCWGNTPHNRCGGGPASPREETQRQKVRTGKEKDPAKQLRIGGKRVPSFDELKLRPHRPAHDGMTYEEAVHEWANDICSNDSRLAEVEFCGAANTAGLLRNPSAVEKLLSAVSALAMIGGIIAMAPRAAAGAAIGSAGGRSVASIISSVRGAFGGMEARLAAVGPMRPPARSMLTNEGRPLTPSQGLQSSTGSPFKGVVEGSHGDAATKYLWTIDGRGVNVALEKTPFPTPRGNIVHTNLSSQASIGGEAWFGPGNRVTINAGSGRFGDGAGITRAQWDATVRVWEGLGYKVDPIPFGSR